MSFSRICPITSWLFLQYWNHLSLFVSFYLKPFKVQQKFWIEARFLPSYEQWMENTLHSMYAVWYIFHFVEFLFLSASSIFLLACRLSWCEIIHHISHSKGVILNLIPRRTWSHSIWRPHHRCHVILRR